MIFPDLLDTIVSAAVGAVIALGTYSFKKRMDVTLHKKQSAYTKLQEAIHTSIKEASKIVMYKPFDDLPNPRDIEAFSMLDERIREVSSSQQAFIDSCVLIPLYGEIFLKEGEATFSRYISDVGVCFQRIENDLRRVMRLHDEVRYVDDKNSVCETIVRVKEKSMSLISEAQTKAGDTICDAQTFFKEMIS